MILVVLALQAASLSQQGQAALRAMQESSKTVALRLIDQAQETERRIRSELDKPSPDPSSLRKLVEEDVQLHLALDRVAWSGRSKFLQRLSPADQIAWLQQTYPKPGSPPKVYIPVRP